MVLSTRRKLLLAFCLIVFVAGAWIFTHRVKPVALENYVPENALGFIEVNDLPELLDHFTSTNGWKELAPVYGLSGKISYAGWLGKLGRWTGLGTNETLVATRGQFGLVITGIEVRGDDVKPHWALIVETHGSEAQIKSLMDERFRQLATRVYKQPILESSEYAGVPVTIYRAPQGERKILSAHLNSEWIIANDASALQSCLDTRQGRIAAISKNSLLARARKDVRHDGDIFGFVSNSGTVRLSQFFAHILAGKVLEGTPLAGLLENIVSEIANNTLEGMAYSANFENGNVVDRYTVFCKPDIANSLRLSIRPANNAIIQNSPALKLVPGSAQEVTIFNIEDPSKAIDDVEKIISSNIGAAQTFLFHRFFTAARKTFLGLEPNENGSGVIGNEILRIGFETSEQDSKNNRLWLISSSNPGVLKQIAVKLLSQQSRGIKDENYQGLQVQTSGDNKRAFTFVNNFLALGEKDEVLQLITGQREKNKFVETAQYTSAQHFLPSTISAIYSFRSVSEDSEKMLNTLANRMKSTPQPKAEERLSSLPLSASIVNLNEQGIQIESHSTFGHFPGIIEFLSSLF